MKSDRASMISSLMGGTERGDLSAGRELFAVLYAELHRLAQRELVRRGKGVSLSPTTLLHEAYLGIAGQKRSAFPDEARFTGYAVRVMRGLIIDHVRRHGALKRGGHFEITQLGTVPAEDLAEERELTSLSEALDELAQTDPPLAQVVDLKFFCGFSFAEIAALHNVSERTAQRQWEKARIYLHRSLCGRVAL
ncbi:MAG: sigma-70 family RNA polymerase sigma factor [Acidobacteria bacterium]|nr:MAG: sigma-70 family RNA polymerase sigma factor [Acidobacteriota bacterium]